MAQNIVVYSYCSGKLDHLVPDSGEIASEAADFTEDNIFGGRMQMPWCLR